MKGLIKVLLSIWNPFPKKWKLRWGNGKPVLDIRQRKINKQLTEAEIERRLKNKEGLNKCYRIKSRSSLDLSGKSA